MAKPKSFGDIISEKPLSDPYIIFLVRAYTFFDGSKIFKSVLCKISKGTFIRTLVQIGQVVSEEKIFERYNIKNSEKTLKKDNNSNMASD